MDTYTHTDGDGGTLSITEADRDWGSYPAAFVRASPDGVVVDPGSVRKAAEALYLACGLPVPVILERPETTANGAHTPVGRVYPFRSAKGDRVAFNAVTGDRFLTPAEARAAAAVLAAYADDAEAREPDPAEVEELAALMHAEACTPACAMRLDGHHHTAARAALRWMNAKAARDDA